jgi:hypothetical protein
MKKKLFTLLTLLSLSAYAQQGTEDFEGTWTPGQGPAGWSIINVAGPLQWSQSLPEIPLYSPYAGQYAAILGIESLTEVVPTEDWLISPSYVVPANAQVSFFSNVRMVDGVDVTFRIMVSDGSRPADTTTYSLLREFSIDEINLRYPNYTHITVALPEEYIGENLNFAIVMTGSGGTSWVVDNAGIIDSCPIPLQLNAANISAGQATLGWTDPWQAAGYEIVVLGGEEDFNLSNIQATANPATILGMQPGNYKFFVRAACDNNAYSQWAGPYFFSTFPNRLTGIVNYDNDGDGLCNDANAVLTSSEVKVSINGEYTYSAYTNNQGIYTLDNLPAGTNSYGIQARPYAGFAPVTPISEEILFDTQNAMANSNICVSAPLNGINDLDVVIVPVTGAHPGLASKYEVIAVNNGTTTISAPVVELMYPAEYVTLTGAGVAYTAYNPNSVALQLGDILPFSTSVTDVDFDILPTASQGLNFGAYVISNDDNPTNNDHYFTQPLEPDPSNLLVNNIFVNEGEYVAGFEAQPEYLHYTISFQNINNTAVASLEITNELDNNFDLSTFQPLSASHAYTVQRSGNHVRFKFEGINLSSGINDETESRGFLTYRVRPIQSIHEGDVVNNVANIYFDNENATTTNNSTTTFYSALGVKNAIDNAITLYPNPVKSVLNIDVKNQEIKSVMVFDVNGRQFLSSGSATIIDVSRLQPGIYFAKVNTSTGSQTRKIIKQ